jgi:zinc protease
MSKLRPLALAVAAWLAVAPPAAAKLFEPTTYTLANGLQVVVIEDHRAPVVVHMVWYKVGAADERRGKSGIAHFLEHLMFKGTPSVPPGEFSKIVARNGGRDNAFTSQDYTGYFQTVARDRLELVMRLEADRMANLVLTDAVVDPERTVVLEERSSRTDNEPASLLYEQMSAAQFLNHPYGVPIIGWEHEIRGLTAADALAFYRTHYAPNNAVLIVAGDVAPAEVKALAEKYYGPVAARPVPPRRRAQEPAANAARRVVLEDARVRQPQLARSYLAPSRSAGEKRHAMPLIVLAEILGGGATSRLHRGLVLNGGVASSAGAWYDSVSLDQSTFTIYATPKPGGDLAAVEAGIDRVVGELLRDGVSAAEVERAKVGLLASAVYARDSLFGAARTFGAALTAGLSVDEIEAWPDLVRAVTLDEVNAAARYVLEPKRSVTGLLRPKPAS